MADRRTDIQRRELRLPAKLLYPEMESDLPEAGDNRPTPKPYVFRGGCDTSRPAASLPDGSFSMIQNMRQAHPGMVKRAGCIKLHSVADGANGVKSLFLFSKGKTTERHFYAQMSDDDVLEATAAPPGVTVGAFGSQVFVGSNNSIPASWGVIDDMLLFSNGVDQHQIYPGTTVPVAQFIVYKGGAAIPDVPEIGQDYTTEVTDGDGSTLADLSSLADLATGFDCFYIRTHVPAKTFTFTIPNPNGTAATLKMKYWKNTGAWTVQAITDNTADAGATLALTGQAVTFTAPTDMWPKYVFGTCGFWYQFYLDAGGALDVDTKISAVTYEADWQAIQNVWDSIPVDAVETQVFLNASSTYKSFGATSIEVGALTSSDKVYFNAGIDPIEGFYVDPGKKPQTTGSRSIDAVYYWNGSAWASVGTVNDGTTGLTKPGWVTFTRAESQPSQFGKNQSYGRWYYFTVNNTISGSAASDVTFSLKVMPYFDISELGKGLVNAVWKDRACYVFEKTPEYLHISAAKKPLVLNGADYTLLPAGDGRKNKIVCAKKFHNELLVWQEEKGKDGGCLTLFEGYSPATFGRLLLSSHLGTFNANSACVVDDVTLSTRTDEKVRTIAAFLSHFGVYVTEGTVPQAIHDLGPGNSIANYFDPTKTECIRAGYESKMWLKYDSSCKVLRLGLVSGTVATGCNIFPVFDLQDRTWSFDVLGQELATMEEVEAGSGNAPIVQVGGGIEDGFVYLLNSGTNDVDAAIDAYATLELDAQGLVFLLREIILRMKAQSAGDCTLTPSLQGVAQSATTLAMTVTGGEPVRRHRFATNLISDHVSLKFQQNGPGQLLHLIDLIIYALAYGER